MTIDSIKENLQKAAIYHSEESMLGHHCIIGYDKRFRWRWLATQLNTFIVAADLGDEAITADLIEGYLSESFEYSMQNYKGWPRGLQSGVAVIAILISSNVTTEAKEYCEKLKSGSKWAAFTVPVVHDSSENMTYRFLKRPSWGLVYYPHFRKLINELKSGLSQEAGKNSR
ncbi:MAG: hypothetical protein AAFO69_06345 [Bacteroidota bacterium]